MAIRILEFLAIVLLGLILIPSGAHLFTLPNKIGLAQDQYFIVQNIYRGWALFGAVIFPALIVTAGLAWMSRANPPAMWLALLAAFCIAGSLAVFFIWVYPANVATENWMSVPADWTTLRRHWEYGHVASAILTFIAFCSVTLAAVSRNR